MVRYNFEWDPELAERNLTKHEVAFENAATVIRDPNALSVLTTDEDHSGTEERWITMGFDTAGALLVVHHTFQNVETNEKRIRFL